MSNQLSDILKQWQDNKDELDWVLGSIITTKGSAYRKTGAHILINSLGQHFGLLSGGCLEADILRHAQQVMLDGKAKIIQYDMCEEGDPSWKLGIGCGGLVKIALQAVNKQNNYQDFDAVLHALEQRVSCYYQININDINQKNQVSKDRDYSESILNIAIKAVPHLAIFGGGIDARPMVAMADQLGWKVSLIDHRNANARTVDFPKAHAIYKNHVGELKQGDILQSENFLNNLDAIIIMGHSLSFDAAALSLSQQSSARYIGLLGPSHRKEKVLRQAKLKQLKIPVAGPIGLDLGGDLPESIALSVLAEIHAKLERRSALSLSNSLILPAEKSDKKEIAC